MNINFRKLFTAAQKAQKNAYAPYSRFKVGAAVLTRRGNIYTGANVESASYGLTLCAERVALAKAVTSGERDIVAVAIAGGKKGQPLMPCGACRQVLSEFDKNMTVITADNGSLQTMTLSELLPRCFGSQDLKRKRK